MGTAQWRTLLADTPTLAALAALADRLGLPYRAVLSKARQMNWRGTDEPALPPITMTVAEIEAAIAAGSSIAKVASGMGVSGERVRHFLRKAGSTAGAVPSETDLAVSAIRAHAMRKAGLTRVDIARALGVPFNRVAFIIQAFDEHGRRLRPKKTQLRSTRG